MRPTQRFSDRVRDYVRYRPSYPDAMVEYLARQVAEPAAAACADFGSGTGLLSGLLAERFGTVYGIEPNREMRAAAEAALAERGNFVSVDGSAEASGLADGSVDLATAAQAFHWFDRAKFARECRRILVPGGRVALIWNNRLANTPFLQTYDALLRAHATDYERVNHQNLTGDDLARFFSGAFETRRFPNRQRFDLQGVLGRLDSSSYAPKPGTDDYAILRRELTRAFAENERGGTIDFNYATEVYLGGLG